MASRTIGYAAAGVSLALVIIIELSGFWIVKWIEANPTMVSWGAGWPISLRLFATVLMRILQIAALVRVIVKFEGSLDAVGWQPASWPAGLKKGAIWSMGFAAAAAIGMAALYFSGTSPLGLIKSPLPGKTWNLTLFLVVAGLIAPIYEELLFRGVLYTFFRRWGFMVALIASTALFVLMHTIHGVPVTQIVGGVVFAIAYETSKNLMVPITIHCLGNTAIYALSLI